MKFLVHPFVLPYLSPRTPDGVRGYGKICFLTEALRNTYNGKLLALYFRNLG